MKIAITSEGMTRDSLLDPRFGRAKYFQIYNDVTNIWELVDNKQNYESPQGAGIQAASTVANKKCNIIITGHCGPKAFKALSAAGIAIYLCESGTVSWAIERFKKKSLNKLQTADVEGHW
jgi:predicted Fe-Mo cluster-binding NifX family protein